ncbi:flagellin [Primorskyibacter flagellatus]|uniref:Flagellin n=1 Tax=Primorskyibacter flagellatus TaxID=1387277 RepID=A0A1W2EN44_9RHOB|nr:flagellin [Primorskyibacter flagellatus]SMD11119.1 flagellin [Primorskyibacter flagellatus]
MSSILTNNSAMVALQTLKSINSGLAQTQSQISTGKNVASAKDNSAIWAISKVMESDVKGFKAISDSLSLGESTVAVARQASETITDLLTQMKGKIVAAQEDNVDRDKINDDVTALKNQIASVVGAAQFNGLNLVNGGGGASILSSLDRDSAGNVTASSITVAAQDLSQGGYTANDIFSGSSTGSSGNGDAVAFALDAGGGNEQVEIAENGLPFAAGDKVALTVGGETVSYTVTADDAASTTTADVVAVALKSKIDNLNIAGLTVDYDSGTPGTLDFTNAGAVDLSVSGQFTNAGSGGLGALAGIDVSTAGGATAALAAVETLIDTSIEAAAAFGSVEGRISTQADFISNLTDSLTSGIGAMVDADMEEASARLQALQVQQQLGVQALSIANQAPQSLLSLFR